MREKKQKKNKDAEPDRYAVRILVSSCSSHSRRSERCFGSIILLCPGMPELTACHRTCLCLRLGTVIWTSDTKQLTCHFRMVGFLSCTAAGNAGRALKNEKAERTHSAHRMGRENELPKTDDMSTATTTKKRTIEIVKRKRKINANEADSSV